jgi:acetoin utilization deacetylase AcuC-like enzyme
VSTYLYHHPAFLDHDTGPTNPESVARLEAVLERLKEPEFHSLHWQLAPRVAMRQLLAVHDASYVDTVLSNIPVAGRAEFEASGTTISARSEEAILRAPGAGGLAGNAFCAVRPPGHHAKKAQTSGFCFFNNVAVGVRHLQQKHGLRRVAIVDFDVHHGNGTQAHLEHDPDNFLASTHQGNIFPKSGPWGVSARGNVINIPVARRYSGADFLAALTDHVLPPMRAFGPEFIFLSAGFDAHNLNPIGDLDLASEDFGRITRAILGLAGDCCCGRVVSVLEGGYAPGALASGCAAHVAALMNAGSAGSPGRVALRS